MTLLPVIERELRAESRNALTYWLRVVGGATLVIAGVAMFLDGGLPAQSGGKVFCILHVTLYVATWIVVPLMTADCISREKREGTLGLLFLTPLRAFEVVLAKGLAHGLRALALCIAAVPVVVVPFLLGGVGWKEALSAVLVELSACGLALGAGVLSSAWNKSMAAAMSWAVGLAGAMAVSLFLVLGLLPIAMAGAFGPRTGAPLWRVETVLEIAVSMFFQTPDTLQWLSQNSAMAGLSMVVVVFGAITLGSAAGVLFMLFLAAVGVKRHAHERPRSAARQQLEKQLFTPRIGVPLFRRWMRRLLERNPMGWLERRTWQSRLLVWTWISVLVLLYSLALPGAYRYGNFEGLNTTLAWLLIGNAALSACCSLRRERETGVLELLLVSPLTVGQIITGRLRGLWSQFLPAAAILCGLWMWMLNTFSHNTQRVPEAITTLGFLASCLLSLPVIGLYYSMRCRMLVVALFCTAMVGLVLPGLVASLANFLVATPGGRVPQVWLETLIVTSGLGAFRLAAWPLRGLPALSFVFAAGLVLTCLAAATVSQSGSTALNNFEVAPTTVLFALLQLGIAVGLGAGLRQLLERRHFTLPA